MLGSFPITQTKATVTKGVCNLTKAILKNYKYICRISLREVYTLTHTEHVIFTQNDRITHKKFRNSGHVGLPIRTGYSSSIESMGSQARVANVSEPSFLFSIAKLVCSPTLGFCTRHLYHVPGSRQQLE